MKFAITDKIVQIFQGKICPYCNGPSEFFPTSEAIYGSNYGPVYVCKKCEAYVGCHKGTTVALGRLADITLRALKMKCHSIFDQTWQSQLMTRDEAYAWLAGLLDLPSEYTHIGMFGPDTCKRIIRETKLFLNQQHDADVAMKYKPFTEKFTINDELGY